MTQKQLASGAVPLEAPRITTTVVPVFAPETPVREPVPAGASQAAQPAPAQSSSPQPAVAQRKKKSARRERSDGTHAA